MTNLYETPEPNSPALHSENAPQAGASGLWYLLLLPIALLYTLAAREVAGPGYTTAPNQGAMVVVFLATVAWPVIAMILVGIIRRVGHIRGTAAAILGFLSWIASSAVPYLIGPK